MNTKKRALWIVLPLVIVASYFIYKFLQPRDLPITPPVSTTKEASPNESASPQTPRQDAVPFRIGIVTADTSQSYDEFLGAREVMRLYGDAENGGMIRHVTYPENFMSEIETTIARITDLAADPLMKVIVVNQGVPGTAEAIRKVKERRPDIFCMVGEAHEDAGVIASAADLAVFADFISRGYLIPRSAKELGADTFVHISFPRHMIDEPMSRRRAIMERACRDLGIAFAFENAPDPMGDAGIDGARRFIDETFPSWIEKYGENAAFFCTNDAHTEPLLRQIAEHGGYFVEADVPSPLLGYPGAFGIDIDAQDRDWPAILEKIEDSVVKAGAGGRMGTWAYSLAFCHSAGLVEFGRLVASGQAEITDKDALIACYGKFSPGAAWNENYYTNARTGGQLKNCVLVYQDTYVFGKGYLGVTEAQVPTDYLKISAGTDKNASGPKFHIGIATGNITQGADDLLGAREMIRLYGNADEGGMIRHVIYPDNFMDEIETTIKLITELADDPFMKVIVVNQAIPGTAEGFRRVKGKRPDIICLAGETHEDTDKITSVADLVVNSDFISRGYLIPYLAQKLGAKTFVHVSFARHMEYETMNRRRAIMERACDDLGMNFANEEAPDPTGETGVDGARKFILEKFPSWIEKYGRETAFFCTNDAHTEPILQMVAANGCFFIEADLPSPFMGYPDAFGVEIQDGLGDWRGILKKIEAAVVEAGVSGRMGTWVYTVGFIQTTGMAEFGRLIADGRAKITDTKTLLECYGKFSPGAKWNGTYFMDAVTAKLVRNYFLIYQDTYIFGKGYMGMTGVEIPEKYLMIGTDYEVQRSGEEGL
jgi:DNA-binding LacI/PurR family transcriptional regulator